MSLYYQLKDNSIIISGSTFPYKDRIKQMGPARFDGINKAWVLPYEDSVLESVKEMCKRVGGGEKKEAKAKPQETTAIKPVQTRASSSVAKPNMDGMKIAELMERLDQTIRNNFYSPIWIIAEIQSINFRDNKKGNNLTK